MNIILWVIYIIASCVDSYASEHHQKRYAKVILMPLLMLMAYMHQVSECILYLSLLLSWLGDILLIQKTGKRNLAGLFCFLAAHICYCDLFGMMVKDMPLLTGVLCVIPYILFAIFYIHKVWCHAPASLKYPSLIYMGCIVLMSYLSLLAYMSFYQTGSLISFIGTVSFIISDTLISDQTFRKKEQKGVMETYSLAQGLIVLGILL